MNLPTLFKAIVKPNLKAQKVLFYITSYAFPWWVYAIAIARFRRMGYEVVAYDLFDEILQNDDPDILPRTVSQLIDNIQRRRQAYEAKGILTFHGIGNSLGSYMLFNYTLHYPLSAIVLNGGGSMADIIFHHNDGSWNKIATDYTAKGHDRAKLRELWADVDLPELGRNIQAAKVLITYSLNDGTIPLASTEAFVAGIKTSGKPVTVKTDNSRHVISIIVNAMRVKTLYMFLNSQE